MLGKGRASLVLSEKAEGGELFPGEENKVRIKLQRQSIVTSTHRE